MLLSVGSWGIEYSTEYVNAYAEELALFNECGKMMLQVDVRGGESVLGDNPSVTEGSCLWPNG